MAVHRQPASALTPRAPRSISPELAAGGFWLAVGIVIALRGTGLSEVPAFATFGVIFASIVIEALPFILLGALVSAAMAVWVPGSVFERVGRLPAVVQVPAVALSGFVLPVCECGSVPVARRLNRQGIAPAAAVAFMLSAPILNPIVIASTYAAFGGGTRGWELVGGRCGLGLIIAIAAGVLVTRRGGPLLRAATPDEHDHEHDHGGRAQTFSDHLVGDFVGMGRFLVLGAGLSALLQTVVPQDVLSGVAGDLILAPLAMMALAFLLSLCSQADAFVATSFAGFGLGAQLAFLVIGPMADTKLVALYAATFRRGFVVRLLAVSVPLCLIGSLLFEAVIT